MSVVTKGGKNSGTGNDTSRRRGVVTKGGIRTTIGNYACFVRVRRRRLKGHRTWYRSPISDYPDRIGEGTAYSIDLVRGVRVNGKPRHEFVLGLGTIRDGVAEFWSHAVMRLRDWHGLDAPTRRSIIQAVLRKRIPGPASTTARVLHPDCLEEAYAANPEREAA